MDNKLALIGLSLFMIVLVWDVSVTITNKPHYDYCVQWTSEDFGVIDRNDLLQLCYDFPNSKTVCKYFVVEKDVLVLVDGANESIQFKIPCSRYVDSRMVKK